MEKNRLTNGGSEPGFTLIELLVVVTVIAILVSIALPVFNSVQERARVTQDLNNLRQIGIATQTYLNDHDGIYFAPADNWELLLHAKYLPAWKVFQSPFDKRAPSENDASAPVSYGFNDNAKTNAGSLSTDQIVKTSEFILFAPAQDSGKTVSFSGTSAAAVKVTNTTGSAGVQSGRTRINAVFADLHVESLPWSTFSSDSADPNSGDQASAHWHPDPKNPSL